MSVDILFRLREMQKATDTGRPTGFLKDIWQCAADEIAQLREMTWRPIETAPRDGSWILVSGPHPWLPDMVQWQPDRTKTEMEWGNKYRVPKGWFNSPGGRSRYDDGNGEFREFATCWMPLPTPPPKVV